MAHHRSHSLRLASNAEDIGDRSGCNARKHTLTLLETPHSRPPAFPEGFAEFLEMPPLGPGRCLLERSGASLLSRVPPWNCPRTPAFLGLLMLTLKLLAGDSSGQYYCSPVVFPKGCCRRSRLTRLKLFFQAPHVLIHRVTSLSPDKVTTHTRAFWIWQSQETMDSLASFHEWIRNDCFMSPIVKADMS